MPPNPNEFEITERSAPSRPAPGDVVQVAPLAGLDEVERGRDPRVAQRQARDGGLDGARRPERVPVVGLRPRDGHLVRVRSQRRSDRFAFGAVVQRRARGVRVHVVDIGRGEPRGVDREPHALRGAGPVRAGRRHVVRVVVDAVAAHLGVDPRPSRARARGLLEHEGARALAHHEAVPVLVERPARLGGGVVACAHRAHRRESAVAHGSQRGVDAAGDRDVHRAVSDQPGGFPERDRARGAAHRVRRVRPREAVLDGDVAARGAGERRGGQARVDVASAALDELAELHLGVRDASHGGAHLDSGPALVEALDVDARVVDRELRARHRELHEPVEPPRLLGVHERGGVERAHLGRHVAPEGSRIEERHLGDGRAAGPQPGEEPVHADARGRDGPDAGHDDASTLCSHLSPLPARCAL
jgi:hypothetical protein